MRDAPPPASPAPASPITVNIGVSQSGNWAASGAATISVSGYTVGTTSSASVNVADDDDAPEVRDDKTQLIAQATALQDKYAKLQSQSLSDRSLYLDITEAVKALNEQSSRLDVSWYAPILMRKAINSANGFGDIQAAQVLAQARDVLGIKALG